MTSKEALELAILDCEQDLNDDIYDNKWVKSVLQGLKDCQKALEVLDIIKRSIYSKEIHKYVMNEKLKGQKFMSIGLSIRGDDDINKIKDWLDNE